MVRLTVVPVSPLAWSDATKAGTGSLSQPLLSPDGNGSHASSSFAVAASLLEVVGELGAGGPVAIVVDDLQWADRRSVEALTLLGAPPAGSYLALSHPASDIEAEAQGEMAERLNQTMAEKVTMRDRAQVARFFDGLELVEPGLVRVPEWRPESELEARSPAGLWGAVGRKN